MELLLRNKNFLLLFLGTLLSTLGGSIFFISVVWTAASELGGATAVSVVLSFQALPIIITAPFVGLFVDKRKKKNILVSSSLIDGFVLLFFAVLLKMNILNIWILSITIFVQQFVGSFMGSSFQTLIPLIVKDEDLSKANSLFSSANMLAQLVGLGIGGILVAFLGLQGVVIFNGLLFIASAVCEIFINYKEEIGKIVTEIKTFTGIKEGFVYAWKKIEIKGLILLEGVSDFFGLAIFVLLPVITQEILKIGAEGYGILQAMSSVGSLVCGILMSFITEVKRKYLWMTIFGIILGITFSMIEVISSFWILAVLLFIQGLLIGYDNIIISVILQRETDRYYRGRVFSFRSMFNSILRPIGYMFVSLLLLFLSINQLIISYGIIIAILSLFYLLIPYASKRAKVEEQGSTTHRL